MIRSILRCSSSSSPSTSLGLIVEGLPSFTSRWMSMAGSSDGLVFAPTTLYLIDVRYSNGAVLVLSTKMVNQPEIILERLILSVSSC